MRREQGSSLVEVVISILLMAMLAVPIMSVAMSGHMAAGRAARRVAAAAAVRRISEHLKAYVTADRTLVRGPGDGDDGWHLPGDQGAREALGPGRHVLDPTRWLPAELTAVGGRISYDVTPRRTPLGIEPDVRFSVGWDEP
ncbi:MAG: prepilin-type N-terminal cleavage/methylation domain-containing protein [Elusimicrobia bacterium]|nr:prepilin-type N-terminal cleavage/methylation domain-containing protein [Elusimicrobiota bacterium]